MNDMDTQIFDLPLQTKLISIYDSVKVQSLLNRQACRKIVNSPVFLPHVQNIRLQFPFDKSMPVIQAHFFYCHLTFILYHASNVRFHIRYIIIHVQRYLTGCPALCSKYLNILFSEFHFYVLQSHRN